MFLSIQDLVFETFYSWTGFIRAMVVALFLYLIPLLLVLLLTKYKRKKGK